MHDPTGAIWTLIVVGAVVFSVARRIARFRVPPAAPNAVGAVMPRRRPAPAPARPLRLPAVAPAVSVTLPDDVLPELKLLGEPDAPAARRRLTLGGGPPLGSAAWAANAVIAGEILAPPVSLRPPGATLGPRDAF